METYDAIIVGAGDAPDKSVLLSHKCYLCCCDSAAETVIGMGIIPDAIVGDGDSLTAEFKRQYASIWHQVDEQDDNDLTKATRHCMSLGYRSILYLGCTGRREDHTLGNISLMVRYRRDFGVLPVMLTDHGRFLVGQEGETTYQCHPGQAVSIINFGCTELESEGLKWKVYPATEWWQCTLNKALNNRFSIKSNGFYLVFLTD